MKKEIFTIFNPKISTNPLRISYPYSLGELSFEENLYFPNGANLSLLNSPIFTRLLNLSAIILGVSYYKLRAPFNIAVEGFNLTKQEKELIIDIYENGLAEFFARNNLKRFGKINFDIKIDNQKISQPLILSEKILLPIGGGKDSLVSAQILERAKFDFTPFAVNPRGPINASIEKINRRALFVTRELDKRMIDLSKEEQYYNGHVPSTAINSIIAALCAVLYDYKYIILSNERSASEGNIKFDGREINHQYSKSFQFEKLFNATLSHITNSAIDYFSLLRPFSEAKIGALFAREQKFDKVFSSCNQNFKLNGKRDKLWCNNCPKCRFTFLILAPFMPKDRLIDIFGENLLDDKAHQQAYRELSGLAGHKPWECVGEILEAAAIIFKLSKNKQWQNDKIISNLRDEMISFYTIEKLEQTFDKLMQDCDEHIISEKIKQRVMNIAK